MDYIKIPCDIIEQEWYRNINARLLYLHLLLTANEQGKIKVSLRRLATEMNITLQKLRTAIKHLESGNVIFVLSTQEVTQEVTQEPTQKITQQGQYITICNYGNYKFSKNNNNTRGNTRTNTKDNTNINTTEERKKENSPHTPYKEKNKEDFTENQRFSTTKNVCACACEGQDGTTEKKETKAPPKAPLIDKRREEFRMSLEPYEQKYGKEMCENFFDYWSEYNRSKTKMRCELQKTWQVSKRLATWAKNDYRVNQPSIVYGTSTTSGGYISRQKQQERERAEREAETYRAMQELAASDGGTPLAPLQ